MKIIVLVIIIILVLLIFDYLKQEIMKGEELIMGKNITNITIINVYDNVGFDPKFQTGFGFAAVVKLKDKTILFDTGGDSETLLANLEKAGVKQENINIIVLSHIHDDHTGGLLGFLEKNSNVKVYVPASFPSSFKNEIKKSNAELIEVTHSIKITNGIYSTGELGTWIKEQSLIINSDKGLILITGCSHPGIVNIIKTAKEELINKNVYLVMGGFHHPSIEVVKEFKELGVEKVAPSHCTGDEITREFQKEYQKDFIKSGVGKIIVIK